MTIQADGGIIALVLVFGSLAGCILFLLRTLLTYDPEPDRDDEDGGGRRRSGDPGSRPPDPGAGGEPVWWPEFERQFAAYVRTRQATPRRG